MPAAVVPLPQRAARPLDEVARGSGGLAAPSVLKRPLEPRAGVGRGPGSAAGDRETIYAVYDVAQQGYPSGLDEPVEPVREALRQEATRTPAPVETARLEAAQHVERMQAAPTPRRNGVT